MIYKLKLLKVSPEEAIKVIEADIVEAYKLKDKIYDSYDKISSKNLRADGGAVEKWNRWIKDWKKKTFIHLEEIYISKRIPYNFRDTRGTFVNLGILGHDTSNLIINIEAKIENLNRCVEFIFDNFQVNIYASGDVNYQSGDNSKMEVNNERH